MFNLIIIYHINVENNIVFLEQNVLSCNFLQYFKNYGVNYCEHTFAWCIIVLREWGCMESEKSKYLKTLKEILKKIGK